MSNLSTYDKNTLLEAIPEDFIYKCKKLKLVLEEDKKKYTFTFKANRGIFHISNINYEPNIIKD